MNKHLFPLSLAFVALAVTGCQQDELSVQEPESNSPKSLVAVVEQSNGPSNSRAAFDNKGAFSWSEGDLIGVFSDEVYAGEEKGKVIGNFYEILEYQRAFPWRITSGVGTPVGTFSWVEEDKIKNSDQTFDNIKYAVYPYIHSGLYELNKTVHDDPHYVDGSNFIFNTTEDPNLAYSVNELRSDFIMKEPDMSVEKQETPMHMVGKVKDGKITFRYVTGALYVKLSGLPEKLDDGRRILTYQVEFYSNNRSIGGNYKVDMSRSQPFAESLYWRAGYNPRTFCYIDGNIPTGRTVVLPIACIPGNYNNLHIKVTGVPFKKFRDEFYEQKHITVSYPINANINVQAGQILRMSNDTENIDAVVKVDNRREEGPLNVKAPEDVGAMVTIKFWSPKDYRGIKYVVEGDYGKLHTYNEVIDQDKNQKSDYISEISILDSDMKTKHTYYNELSFKLNRKLKKDDLHISFYLVDDKGNEISTSPFASIIQ